MCTGKAIWARFRRTPPLQPDVRMPSKSCSTRADWMRSIVATIRDTLRSTLRLLVRMQASVCRIKARNCSCYRSQTWSERRYGQYEMPTNMNNKRALRAVLLAILCMSAALCASAQRLTRRAQIVCAEKVYGDVLAQIGGDAVEVFSILGQPNQDPHLFEADASVARRVAHAQLVVYNGAGYDPWMSQLLAASRSPRRAQIEIAQLAGKKTGDNPHFWMLPNAMSALARAAHAVLARVDSVRSSEYDARLADFLASLKPIEQRIATLRARVKGMPITATEPLADYLTQALGLRMRNARFQRAIMKGSEPSVADTAAFEDDLRQRRVKALIDNAQTTSGHARRMLKIAHASGVAVAPFSEILPAGMTYQRWMQRQLDVLERALFP